MLIVKKFLYDENSSIFEILKYILPEKTENPRRGIYVDLDLNMCIKSKKLLLDG